MDELDFEAAGRKRDLRLQGEYQFVIETGSASGNCYLTDYGAVVDADIALYDPTAIVSGPEMVFDGFLSE